MSTKKKKEATTTSNVVDSLVGNEEFQKKLRNLVAEFTEDAVGQPDDIEEKVEPEKISFTFNGTATVVVRPEREVESGWFEDSIVALYDASMVDFDIPDGRDYSMYKESAIVKALNDITESESGCKTFEEFLMLTWDEKSCMQNIWDEKSCMQNIVNDHKKQMDEPGVYRMTVEYEGWILEDAVKDLDKYLADHYFDDALYNVTPKHITIYRAGDSIASIADLADTYGDGDEIIDEDICQ